MKAEQADASTKRRTWKDTATSIIALIICVAMVVLIVRFVLTATPAKLLGALGLIVVSIAVVLLGSKFPIVARTIATLFAAYFLFFGWFFITLVPMMVFLRLSLFVLEGRAVGLQITVFVAWGMLLSFALQQIATERRRERLFNRFKRIGFFAPVAYSLNLLIISVLLFSSVTYVLGEKGILEFTGSPDSKFSPDQVTALYLWHFLEAVPLLKVNDTLRWKEPLTYNSGWVGLALLIFKGAVIIPVIAAFAGYWKGVREKAPSSSTSLPEIIRAVRSADRSRKIIIPGGTGQVGTILARAFHQRGDEVVVLSRSPKAAPWRAVKWDAETLGEWASELEDADVVINLAGRSVNCRYNDGNKKLIKTSRVKSTQVIGEAIARASNPPRLWLQASTATIYAHRDDAANDEATGVIGGSEPNAPDTWNFSIDVVTSWERALNDSKTPHTRKVLLRSAIIMSPDRGGAFDMLLKLVRFRLGGSAGDGEQYVSWIHDQDFIRSIFWLIDHDEVEGPVNLAAPNPVTNAEFMKALREAWGIRFGLGATEWMLKIGAFVLQTETELILKSRRVVPGRLLESKFVFKFPMWADASRDLCTRWRETSSIAE